MLYSQHLKFLYQHGKPCVYITIHINIDPMAFMITFYTWESFENFFYEKNTIQNMINHISRIIAITSCGRIKKTNQV